MLLPCCYLSDAGVAGPSLHSLEEGLLVEDVEVCVHEVGAQGEAALLQGSQGDPHLPASIRRAASNEQQLLLLCIDTCTGVITSWRSVLKTQVQENH